MTQPTSGQETYEAEEKILKKTGVKNAEPWSSDLAGRRVKFAVIVSDGGVSWKGGIRSVMARRNSGIVFHGTRKKRFADAPLLKELAKSFRRVRITRPSTCIEIWNTHAGLHY